MTGLKATFQEAFNEAKPQYGEIVTEVSSTTASEQYNWVAGIAEIRKWVGERAVKMLSGHKYSIQNEDYELTVGIGRNDLEDGAISGAIIGAKMSGAKAPRHHDREAFGLLRDGIINLCYDGQPFFDTEHPVGDGAEAPAELVSNLDASGGGSAFWYLVDDSHGINPIIKQNRKEFSPQVITDPDHPEVFNNKRFLFGLDGRYGYGYSFWQLAYASNQPLTAANFDAAVKAMNEFKNEHGQPMGINPTKIVVGVSNKAAAKQLFGRQLIDGGDSNPNYQAVKVVEVDILK
jgi:phage major head subunit gpT-like protein